MKKSNTVIMSFRNNGKVIANMAEFDSYLRHKEFTLISTEWLSGKMGIIWDPWVGYLIDKDVAL